MPVSKDDAVDRASTTGATPPVQQRIQHTGAQLPGRRPSVAPEAAAAVAAVVACSTLA